MPAESVGRQGKDFGANAFTSNTGVVRRPDNGDRESLLPAVRGRCAKMGAEKEG